MIILAVDTSTEFVTYVVGDEHGVVLASEVREHHRTLSQIFYSGLTDLLQKAAIGFADVDILAVGVGPGSFTGVRVAVTTVRTLAQVTQKPLIGFGTLAVYADDALFAGFDTVTAVLPSRRGEVYFQDFERGLPTTAPSVITYPALLERLTENPKTVLCGQVTGLPNEFSPFSSFPQTAPVPASLLRQAIIKLAALGFDDPLSLTPVYAAPPAISQHKNKPSDR